MHMHLHEQQRQQHQQRLQSKDYSLHQQGSVNMNMPNMGLPNMSSGAHRFVQHQMSQQQQQQHPSHMSHGQPHQSMSSHNRLAHGHSNLFVPLSGICNSGIRGMAVPGSEAPNFAPARPLPGTRGDSEANMTRNMHFDSVSKLDEVAASIAIPDSFTVDDKVLDGTTSPEVCDHLCPPSPSPSRTPMSLFCIPSYFDLRRRVHMHVTSYLSSCFADACPTLARICSLLHASVVSQQKGSRKGGKRSNSITLERMERHKILERKRREKTKELMSELR